MRASPTSSTRLFSRAVVPVALLGLLSGGIIASPAFAVGGLQVAFEDAGGVPIASELMTIEPQGPGPAVPDTATDASGVLSLAGLPDGTYRINAADHDEYAPVDHDVVVSGGLTVENDIVINRWGRAQGTLPADADGTVVTIYVQDGPTSWSATSSSATVGPTGVFDLPVPSAPGADFAVFFAPPSGADYFESWMEAGVPFHSGDLPAVSFPPAYDTVRDLDPPATGELALVPAMIISGTVSEAPDPAAVVAGITVTARKFSGPLEAFHAVTETDGSYRIKVPYADESYRVFVDDGNWATEYYDGAFDSDLALPVTVDTANPQHQDVDFALEAFPPDLFGNVVAADPGPALVPHNVDTYLFLEDASGHYSPEPYDSTADDSDFGFSGLLYGHYRLAFLDVTENRWLPWQSLTYVSSAGSQVMTPGVDDCYVDFQLQPRVGDYEFDDVLVDPDASFDYCDSPPWATGAEGTFSGIVSNYAAVGGPIVANLYTDDGGFAPLWLDSVTVSAADGSYQLDGIYADGQYFVEFESGDHSPWLDTLSDSATAGAGFWAEDPDLDFDDYLLNHTTTLAAGTSSSGNQDELVPGAVLSGTVTSSGSPLEGACVFAQAFDDGDIGGCGSSGADGGYTIKLPQGHQYSIEASAASYQTQFFDHVADPMDWTLVDAASAIEYGGLDFSLIADPTYLQGIAEIGDLSSSAPADGVTVHLYLKAGTAWNEVDTFPLAPSDFGQFYFDENYIDHSFGLPDGDYRMRFEDASGHWIAAGVYATISGSGTPNSVTGPICQIDLALRAGPPTAIIVLLDAVQTTVQCAAESTPGAAGPGSGGSGTGTVTRGVSRPLVSTIVATSTPRPTTSPRATPSPSPDATPAPAAAGEPAASAADLTWLVLLLIVLGVLGLGTAAFFVFRRR